MLCVVLNLDNAFNGFRLIFFGDSNSCVGNAKGDSFTLNRCGYTHFSALLVVPKQQVRTGQPIGIIGGDPLDAAHLMHLHFETWRGGAKDRFDPAPLMRGWEYLPDRGDMPATLVARNARTPRRSSSSSPWEPPSRSVSPGRP